MDEISQTVSVAIVANDPLARAGLATLLAAEPTCDIIAQMNLADWLTDLQAGETVNEWPDGVIWDIG